MPGAGKPPRESDEPVPDGGADTPWKAIAPDGELCDLELEAVAGGGRRVDSIVPPANAPHADPKKAPD